MQAVADDRFHAALAIGAAGLLVGENILERDHLARQRGEILLRRVDDRETLVQLRQRLAGALGLIGEARRPIGGSPGRDAHRGCG